ncbi:hypothetical protein [Pacificimonas flava]|uniref:hypothetical protein n=1 Tax=Pacificimonas flava TaxID=1234595 RepID=UPI0005714F24|nr:hypothetical protein [Pacificimonas flava]MBB5281210.1 hypothetical protein [Pacificimonas flava]
MGVACTELALEELRLRKIVRCQEHLVILRPVHVADELGKRGCMNRIVVLERVIEHQRAPARPFADWRRSFAQVVAQRGQRVSRRLVRQLGVSGAEPWVS